MVGCDSLRILSRRIRCGVALCQLAEIASFRANLPLENCSEKLVVSENSPPQAPSKKPGAKCIIKHEKILPRPEYMRGKLQLQQLPTSLNPCFFSARILTLVRITINTDHITSDKNGFKWHGSQLAIPAKCHV